MWTPCGKNVQQNNLSAVSASGAATIAVVHNFPLEYRVDRSVIRL
jgi:hypothetical protein